MKIFCCCKKIKTQNLQQECSSKMDSLYDIFNQNNVRLSHHELETARKSSLLDKEHKTLFATLVVVNTNPIEVDQTEVKLLAEEMVIFDQQTQSDVNTYNDYNY